MQVYASEAIEDLLELPEEKATAGLDPRFLERSIKLDDEYAKVEEVLFEEFREITRLGQSKFSSKEVEEQFAQALSGLRTRINNAVTSANRRASLLLNRIDQFGLEPKVLVRLEYLRDLTTERQIEVFEEILSDTCAKLYVLRSQAEAALHRCNEMIPCQVVSLNITEDDALLSEAGILIKEHNIDETAVDHLDDLVHQAASDLASTVNNGGIVEQVAFLLEAGWSEEEILKAEVS